MDGSASPQTRRCSPRSADSVSAAGVADVDTTSALADGATVASSDLISADAVVMATRLLAERRLH
jgi:hypothetical protein